MAYRESQYTLRIKAQWTVVYAQVEVGVHNHGHGVETVRCPDAIGPWMPAVRAGIEDAKDELHRRQRLPLEIKILAFEGTEATTERAVRLATCVAIVRAEMESKSWPKVISEGGELKIAWGPTRRS